MNFFWKKLKDYGEIMKIRIIDGGIFEGNSEEQIVRLMKLDQMNIPSDLVIFMEQVSDRCFEFYSADVSSLTPEDFIRDLKQQGFIEEVFEKEDEEK